MLVPTALRTLRGVWARNGRHSGSRCLEKRLETACRGAGECELCSAALGQNGSPLPLPGRLTAVAPRGSGAPGAGGPRPLDVAGAVRIGLPPRGKTRSAAAAAHLRTRPGDGSRAPLGSVRLGPARPGPCGAAETPRPLEVSKGSFRGPGGTRHSAASDRAPSVGHTEAGRGVAR